MSIPSVHETSDGRPLVSQGPGPSESSMPSLSDARPPPGSHDTSGFVEPEVSGSTGRGSCLVEVKDGNGNFQSQVADIYEERHSLVTPVFVKDQNLKPLPLPPPLAIRLFPTPLGVLRLAQFVKMEVRVPQFGIPLTNLYVGVMDQEHPSHGPHFFLGRGFLQKTGRFLSPDRSATSRVCGHEQDDPGDAANGIPRLPPEAGGAVSGGNPLIVRSSVPGLRGPDAAGADVGPTDLNRLIPPGPNMDRRPSLATTKIRETPVFTVHDPAQSSAPTSILLDEMPPSSDEPKKSACSEAIPELAANSDDDLQSLAAYRTKARIFCSSPAEFP